MNSRIIKLVGDVFDDQKDYKSFNFAYYLSCNPDVSASGVNPLRHYLRHGWREGRNPNNVAKSLLAQIKIGIDYRDKRGGKKILRLLDSKGSHFAAPTHPKWRAEIAHYDGLSPEASVFVSNCLKIESTDEQAVHYALANLQMSLDDAIEYMARFGNGFEMVRHQRELLVERGVARQEQRQPDPFSLALGSSPSTADHSSAEYSEPNLLKDMRYKAVVSDIKNRLQAVIAPSEPIGRPDLSVIVPVYDVDVTWLDQMVASVRGQTYKAWELILVDDRSTREILRDRLIQFSSEDPRIKTFFRKVNGGISAATNDAIAMAAADYVAFLDCDDILTCDALEKIWAAIKVNGYPDVIYSDEFKVDMSNEPFDLFAKPEWSYFTLTNSMYTGHLSVISKSFLSKMGGLRSEFDFSQDYDLMLRASEQTDRILHVPHYLYGWRVIEGSGSAGGKPYARLSNIAALQDAAIRRGWNATAVGLPTANKLVFRSDRSTMVSIIVPSDNIDNIKQSIYSIFLGTEYENYEIVVVTKTVISERISRSITDRRVKWIAYDMPFNFSAKCNAGAEAADGKYLIFFNDDVRIISEDWLDGLINFAQLDRVGAVSPKLIYEHGRIQHAGMVTGVRGLIGTAFHWLPSDTVAYFNFAQCVRNVSVLSGALLAMRRDLFLKIGGFDAENAPIKHSDVDLCLRILEHGYDLVYTPHVELTHIGHLSLQHDAANDFHSTDRTTKNKADIYLLKRFGERIAKDPFFTEKMRDLLYADSPEPFQIFAGAQRLHWNKQDILLISHDLSASGAPRVLCELAETLWQAGHYVVVVSPTDGPLRHRLSAKGITVIIDSLAKSSPSWLASFAYDFDQTIVNTIVMWRVVAETKVRSDVLWYIHEGEYIDEVARRYPACKSLLRSSPRVAVVSRHAANYVEKYNCCCDLLEIGLDRLEGDARCEIGERSVKFAMFGSYEPRKGQDIATDAFAIASRKPDLDIQLHMYGRPHDMHFRNELEVICAGVKGVRMYPELSQEEYENKISGYDVIVVTSRDDSLSLVALAAMSIGIPLIVSSTTGISYYLKDGESALIARNNSAQEVAELMIKIATDHRLRRDIGAAGQRIYQSNFTKRHFKDRLSTLLEIDLSEPSVNAVAGDRSASEGMTFASGPARLASG